jgi:hypothetical protein
MRILIFIPRESSSISGPYVDASRGKAVFLILKSRAAPTNNLKDETITPKIHTHNPAKGQRVPTPGFTPGLAGEAREGENSGFEDSSVRKSIEIGEAIFANVSEVFSFSNARVILTSYDSTMTENPGMIKRLAKTRTQRKYFDLGWSLLRRLVTRKRR